MSPLWKDGDTWLNATQVAKLLSVSRNTLKSLMERFIDPLPQPFPFGQNRRWLASQVWTWMERQMAPSVGIVAEIDSTDVDEHDGTGEGLTRNPHDLWIADIKSQYQSGTTLDTLCRENRIGKVRLSALLRQAGTSMRRPGRRGGTARSVDSEVQQ